MPDVVAAPAGVERPGGGRAQHALEGAPVQPGAVVGDVEHGDARVLTDRGEPAVGVDAGAVGGVEGLDEDGERVHAKNNNKIFHNI